MWSPNWNAPTAPPCARGCGCSFLLQPSPGLKPGATTSRLEDGDDVM